MKKSVLLKIIAFIVLAGVLYSCQKEPDPVPPALTTNSVSDITLTSAFSGGNVTDDGESTVTARGVCWSTDPNPVTADSKTSDGSGKGSFTSNITQLTPGTLYYVRAYATNVAGTAYGNQHSFTTNPVLLATITTTEVTSITGSTAVSGGNISDDGGGEITARGVCWSTSTEPSLSDEHTSDGTGTGDFSSSLTGLTTETSYYVRAYATNSAGTAYGQEESFETDWGQSGTFKDTRDNTEYEWVRIGDQIWMAENLAYLPSVGGGYGHNVYGYIGTSVSQAKATSNYQTYGVLYNWTAALDACPSGWHLPTDAEWKTLEMYLGMSQAEADDSGSRGTDEGGKLKETGTIHWESPNTGATNESGFTGLPGGFREFDYVSQGFVSLGIGRFGRWWSATETSTGYAMNRCMYYDYSVVRRFSYYKYNGISVRCLRD